MDLHQALFIIKKNLREKNYIESRHFKEECKDRNLSGEEITKILIQNEILGIVQQDHNLYKIWMFYDENKDLNLILYLLPEEKLRLITVFLCNSERRKRQNATKG